MITPNAGYVVDPNNPNAVVQAPQNTPSGGGMVHSTQAETNAAPAGSPVENTNVQGVPTSVDTLRANSGTFKGGDGNYYYNYDTTKAPAPQADTNTSTSGTGITSIGATSPTKTTVPSTGNTAVDALMQQRQDNADALAAAGRQVSDTILNIQNGVTPLTAGEQAQIDGLKSQFDTLIKDQTLQNSGASGTANIRGYQTGAAEYDPSFQIKTIGSIVSAGAAKVADLQVKEASAVAQMTQAFHDNDIKAITTAWNTYNDAYKERAATLKDTIDSAQAAIKDAADAKIAADKVVYDTVTKPIQDIGIKAAELGASPDTLAKIKGAQTVDDAIAAAGTSIQTSTNPDIAQYLFYKQQAQNAGVTPQSYEDYQKAQATIASQQAYSKAYATAAGSAAGAASAVSVSDTPVPGGLGGDSKGGSILAQTGLSIGAFNFLTQGTASMSRMTASQRMAIMNEAQNYLNKTGTDVSTFQSQYKAYNDVLQKNITRANQTQIMAGEVSGSADALISAIQGAKDANDPLSSVHGNEAMSSLRAANVLDLMLGKATNNKFAQTYATQIGFMANDLAGYLAAARGATSPELQDQRDAANIIANGMNTGSTQAFKDAVNANEAKVAGVVQKAVENAQKQTWGLFGVADKYASPVSTGDVLTQQGQQSAQKVNDYIKQNPDKLDSVTKLYNQNFTDEQVSEYLNL